MSIITIRLRPRLLPQPFPCLLSLRKNCNDSKVSCPPACSLFIFLSRIPAAILLRQILRELLLFILPCYRLKKFLSLSHDFRNLILISLLELQRQFEAQKAEEMRKLAEQQAALQRQREELQRLQELQKQQLHALQQQSAQLQQQGQGAPASTNSTGTLRNLTRALFFPYPFRF